jgi:multiple sugar transport system permease protein
MSVIANKLFGRRSLKAKEAIAGYLFILPFLIGFIWFTAIPMGVAFVISFTEYNIVQPPEWVGLEHFFKLFRDARLRVALLNTTFYAGISVPLYLATSFLAALAMNMKIRGIRIYRTIFYLPSIVPAVASVILWLWIFSPQWGIANYLLSLFGIPAQRWFLDPNLSKICVIIMGLWGIGPTMVIYLAGLQAVPVELYEAAEIDGANAWRKFLSITLPMMSSVTFFNLIMGVINAFQIFAQAFVLINTGAGGDATAGAAGVQDSLLFYVYYLYQEAFAYQYMGYASAMGWLLLVIILILTVIQFKLAGNWVYYETERGT